MKTHWHITDRGWGGAGGLDDASVYHTECCKAAGNSLLGVNLLLTPSPPSLPPLPPHPPPHSTLQLNAPAAEEGFTLAVTLSARVNK